MTGQRLMDLAIGGLMVSAGRLRNFGIGVDCYRLELGQSLSFQGGQKHVSIAAGIRTSE